MSRRRWTNRELVASVPLDKDGWELRLYRKTWEDSSQCIDIQKWVKRPDGSWSFYKPAQYLQLPVSIAQTVLEQMAWEVEG